MEKMTSEYENGFIPGAIRMKSVVGRKTHRSFRRAVVLYLAAEEQGRLPACRGHCLLQWALSVSSAYPTHRVKQGLKHF